MIRQDVKAHKGISGNMKHGTQNICGYKDRLRQERLCNKQKIEGIVHRTLKDQMDYDKDG
jgi:hypothetical protein